MNCNYKYVCTTSSDFYCFFDGRVCDELCTEHINNYLYERDKKVLEKLKQVNEELDEIAEKVEEIKKEQKQ